MGHDESRVSHSDAHGQQPATGVELHASTLVSNVGKPSLFNYCHDIHHQGENHIALDSRWRLCRAHTQAREYMDTGTTRELRVQLQVPSSITAASTSRRNQPLCSTGWAQPAFHERRRSFVHHIRLDIDARERFGRLAHLQRVRLESDAGFATFLYRTAVRWTSYTRHLQVCGSFPDSSFGL